MNRRSQILAVRRLAKSLKRIHERAGRLMERNRLRINPVVYEDILAIIETDKKQCQLLITKLEAEASSCQKDRAV